MYTQFINAFFGSGYEPNDFELTFALFVLVLFMYGISEIFSALGKFFHR